jgi:hypothetical protein
MKWVGRLCILALIFLGVLIAVLLALSFTLVWERPPK